VIPGKHVHDKYIIAEREEKEGGGMYRYIDSIMCIPYI
jgi:hypothetical protein